MKYRNTKTGAVIDSPCTITGGYWEPVEGKKAPREASSSAKTLRPTAEEDASRVADGMAKPPKKTARKKAAK